MKQRLSENIADLLCIKSIITLCAMAMFVYVTVTDKISGETVITIITTVVSFYFGMKFTSQHLSEHTPEELNHEPHSPSCEKRPGHEN